MKKIAYSNSIHPAEQDLSAYFQQSDSPEFGDISLHLAGCTACREQLSVMSLIKCNAADLMQNSCDDEQRQKVDDFIYADLSAQQKEVLKQDLKQNSVLLKSALHGLSQQAQKYDLDNDVQSPSSSLLSFIKFSFIKEGLLKFSRSWLSIPVTAMATLMLSVLVFQVSGLFTDDDVVTVASYQDSNNIRFIEQNKLPGIGFFTSARQRTEPYQNIKISITENQLLNLQWHVVKGAEDYNLRVSRYSEGNKRLLKNVTTVKTEADLQLTETDFNQRFEWTLSGKTTEGKTFITSGGFVINRK